MANTVKVQAPAGTGVVTGTKTNQNYVPDATGQFLADPLDIQGLVSAGFTLCNNRVDFYTCTPLPANAGAQFASAALTNGTKAIVAQPDFPRQLEAVITPGVAAITAGILALTYVANDGSTVTDNLSLAAPISTAVTVKTSRGVMKLVSQIISGLVGGSSPTISIGTNATIAVPTNTGAAGITFFKEVANTGAAVSLADEAVGTPVGVYGLITPTTAPATTKTIGFGYTYTSP